MKNILIPLVLLAFTGSGNAYSQISFTGNWESGITGKGTWGASQIVAADRFQRVMSPVRQGLYSARVEVRPGDDPINSTGNRSEVLHMTNSSGTRFYETESSGTQYYAFSFMLDASWQTPSNVNGAWAIIFQLHGPDDLKASPSFAVSIYKNLNIAINGGDLDNPSKSVSRSYPLTESTLNIGHWVDLVIKIKFAQDFNGAVEVWRRNEGEMDFKQVLTVDNIPTLQYKSSLGGVGNHYWKHGLYCSKQTAITNFLWLDGMVRGNTYHDVLNSAFGITLSVLPDKTSFSSFSITPRNQHPGSMDFLVELPNAGNFCVKVTSASGRTVWETIQKTTSAGITVVDWNNSSEQPQGLYFVTLSQKNYQKTSKFILNKK